MGSKRVRSFVIDDKSFDVLDVALHAWLHMLLGVTQVDLIRRKAFCSVHYYRVPAVASVWTCLLVPAVAREILEIFWDNIAVEFGVQVTLKQLTEVGESMVRHWYLQPLEWWEPPWLHKLSYGLVSSNTGWTQLLSRSLSSCPFVSFS
jgi:hypothetical protein